MSKLSREVAEASRVADHDLPSRFVSAKQTDVLVQTAKRLQRLQTRRGRLKKELRKVEQDIRLEKRHLNALVQSISKAEA